MPLAARAPAPQAALEELLANMRDEYSRRLPENLAHIEVLWREMAGGDDSRREELLRAAHSIAGAAATFGLPEVGDVARELERMLQPLCARGGAPNDQDRGRIEDGIAQLRRVSPSAIADAGERK
jgi:HPt (histidine-containing phosphotransfer) domain-containing protein